MQRGINIEKQPQWSWNARRIHLQRLTVMRPLPYMYVCIPPNSTLWINKRRDMNILKSTDDNVL